MNHQFDFLNKIKKQIRPDKSVLIKVNKFLKKINNEIKKKDLPVVCVAGGSVAKGTYLKNDFDIDLFVKFNYSFKKKNLSHLLEKILLKFKDKQKVHGSRDYFQIMENDLNYEIVPVLDIRNPDKAENVTDMSPLHVNWVKKNLKNGIKDEIRLAKKFCKAQKIYGAESYIRGFSGHVLDILLIYYGSFLDWLKNGVKWKSKEIIDIENHYKNKEVLFHMNKSKTKGPLVVIDPILPERNAAAALSTKNFQKFRKKAKEFLINPSEKFFRKKKITKTYLNKKAGKNKLLILKVEPFKQKTDISGSKLLKTYEFIKRKIKKNGFDLIDSGWDWDKKNNAKFWYIIYNKKLPEYKKITGPYKKMTEHVKAFKKKYDEVYVKDNRIYARTKTEHRTPEKFIQNLIQESEYIKEKVNWISIYSS
ncbi:CCA tRNA nucleotidyltransferase [Candidatus Woesearchaeota archaeon]|nr:CCA tRNA nucleotidyltransferase [Candidatus Woesearchaeota archaeon]